jgi:hypothetical protein
MSQWLFEHTLLNTKHKFLKPELLHEDVEQVTEEDVHQLTEMLRVFADGLDEDLDLETQVEQFAEYLDFDPEDTDLLKYTLVETAKAYTGEADDNSIRSFLKTLSQPYPKAEKRYPNQEGMTPLAGEDGIKAFLKKLPVNAYPDSYGFDAARFHAACNTVHHVHNEAKAPIASTPITEGIFNNQRVAGYAAYLNKPNPSLTMGANLAQSDYTVNHAKQWRESQTLLNERKDKFAERSGNEFDAIRSVLHKGNPRSNQSLEGYTVQRNGSDRDFLHDTNTRGKTK